MRFSQRIEPENFSRLSAVKRKGLGLTAVYCSGNVIARVQQQEMST